jgi:hypothetical protein
MLLLPAREHVMIGTQFVCPKCFSWISSVILCPEPASECPVEELKAMMKYNDDRKPRNEVSSKELRTLAARLIKHEDEDVRRLAASVLTQSPDRPPRIQTK